MAHWLSKPPPGTPLDQGWKQSTGCVGLWLMNEGGGGKIYNLANRSGLTDGTLTGGVNWTGGKFGSALAFDGSNGFVNTNYDFSWSNSQSFTMSAWVKMDTLGYRMIIGKGNIWNDWEYGLRVSNTGIPNFIYWNTTGQDAFWMSGSSAIDTVSWWHIVATYNGVTNGYLYVNGVLVGSSGIVPMTFQDRSAATTIGRGYYAGGNEGIWDGLIDLPCIFNKALPLAEIQRQYAQPFYMFPKRSAILYFDLGGGTTYEVSLSLGGIGGITQTNIATLNNSVEVAGVSGMTDTNIATFIHSLNLGAISDISNINIASLLNGLSLAGLGGITEDQVVTILGNIAIEAKSGITETNIATLLNSLSLDTIGDISQANAITILSLLSLNGISDVSFSNIGTLLNSLSLDATAGITESNIAALLNALNLGTVDAFTITTIATLYNSLGFTSIGDISFPFGDIYDVSLAFGAVANIANVQSYIVVGSVSFTASGAMTITNIATLQNSLTLSQIATLATWGVLTSEKLRIIAVTAKALYCIGVDTKQLYEISVESK